jgi:hypothetical protein
MLNLIAFFFGIFSEIDPHLRYRSFAVENSEVVWVQVYAHDSAHHYEPEKVFEQLKKHPWLANVRLDGQAILADLHDFKVDFRKFDAKAVKTSTIIRTGRWDGKARIIFKNGKYRVMVYGLHYVAMQPKRTAGKVSFEAHEISGTLSQWALHDHRTSFKKSTFYNLDLLHMSLKEVFALGDFEIIEENW